jgi:hypothetical protein
MNERAFRLDFVIAMGALLVSALTAGTLLYQTHVISDQYAATIWPYLSVTTTYDPHGVMIEVGNDGLGPALIRSAQLNVDGKNVATWRDFFGELSHDAVLRKLFLRQRAAMQARRPLPLTVIAGSIGNESLRPGQARTLLEVHSAAAFPVVALATHAIAIDFCYCSLNGSCWNLQSVSNQSRGTNPQPVSGCTSSAQIGSTLANPPSHPTQ